MVSLSEVTEEERGKKRVTQEKFLKSAVDNIRHLYLKAVKLAKKYPDLVELSPGRQV